jgi:hypothetical protein
VGQIIYTVVDYLYRKWISGPDHLYSGGLSIQVVNYWAILSIKWCIIYTGSGLVGQIIYIVVDYLYRYWVICRELSMQVMDYLYK